MPLQSVSASGLNQFSIQGVEINAEAIRRYNDDVPLSVAKAALQDNGLDEVIFKAGGKTFIAYADGLDLSGLKKGNIPSEVLKGEASHTLFTSFQGRAQEVEILHVNNETNTAWEGAKTLAPITLISQAIPNGIQIGLAPAAARAAKDGTNFMAKVSRFVGGKVSAIGSKVGLNAVGMGIAAGVLTLGVGVAGGAIYYGKMRGEERDALEGLIKK